MKVNRRGFLQMGVGAPLAISWLGQEKGIPILSEYRTQQVASGQEPRTEVSLNGVWRFQPTQTMGTANPLDPDLDDRDWPLMTVPDFWRPIDWWLYSPGGGASAGFVEKEEERVAQYKFGIWDTRAGWYRHGIEVPAELRGRRLTVHFSGVASVADVWCNGQHVRSHIGMFGPFECDITPQIRWGQRNQLSVYVAASQVEMQAETEQKRITVPGIVTKEIVNNLAHGGYDLEWKERNGGIWAPVRLIVSDPLRIDDLFFRSRMDGASIEVNVGNSGSELARCTVRPRLYDRATGELFYEMKAGMPIQVSSGEQKKIALEIDGLHPRLWSPDFPNLYRLETLLEKNGQLVDKTETIVGFRTFEVRGDRFYLNGHPYFLRGADTAPYGCRPHDQDLAKKFMSLMHEGNEVVTRFHTTGVSETWASAADVAGVGASVEGVYPWMLTGDSELPDPKVVRYWQEDQLALFRSLRNHPCILIWDINNEMRFHGFPLPKFHYFDTDRARRLKKWKIISDMIKMIRKMDPTRPIIASSEYTRTRQEYVDDLKPNDIDDGDIDDIHVYNGWHGPSGLFVDVKTDLEEVYSQFNRPLISQEASTGFANNDTGYPADLYLYVQRTTDSWLGQYVLDPKAPFLDLNARITREWIEKIRRHRTKIAGWMLFSNCDWFRHATDAKRIEPYRTYHEARYALQPVLVSLESPNRHFVKGERFVTDVYIVNDDPQARDWDGLVLDWSIQTPEGKVLSEGHAPMPRAIYYSQVKRQVEFRLPDAVRFSRDNLILKLGINSGRESVSENVYPIVLTDPQWFTLPEPPRVTLLGRDQGLKTYLESLGLRPRSVSSLDVAAGSLAIIGSSAIAVETGMKSALHKFVHAGGRVLFLNPSPNQRVLLPLPLWKISERFGTRTFFGGTWNAPAHWGGEIVSIAPEHPLVRHLQPPEDLRWWNAGPIGPTVCEWAFDRPKSAEKYLISLCDYTAPQGVASSQEASKFRASAVIEARVGKGRLIASTLRLADDPLARRLIANLVAHAAGHEQKVD